MATRWGIFSAGKISHDFAVALGTLPAEEHKIVAIASRNLATAKPFAKKFNIEHVYEGYETLAQDPDIDIVYIGSIHPEHRKLCLLCFEHGKHVLCEKPLTLNVKHTQELITRAKEKGVFLMEACWSRFFPAYEKLREELENKTIGTPDVVQVDFGQAIAHIPRLHIRELGGGALLDIGIYGIQLACLVFNEKPLSITAVGHLFPTGVDECCMITLMYSGGRMASITISARTWLCNRATIAGSEGIIEVPNRFWCPTELVTPKQKYDFPLPESSIKTNCVNSVGMRYEAMAARESIQKGLLESPIMSHADTLMVAEIAEEARRQLGVQYDADTE